MQKYTLALQNLVEFEQGFFYQFYTLSKKETLSSYNLFS